MKGGSPRRDASGGMIDSTSRRMALGSSARRHSRRKCNREEFMHKLLVLYNEPKDPAHFRKYYVETHVPLASKLPGLKASRYSFDAKPLGPGKAHFCIFEAEFESEAALMAALQSKEGKAVAGDVPNYATGGVTMVHFAIS
jgi:uncharacterized protein (TIGR02118 family)